MKQNLKSVFLFFLGCLVGWMILTAYNKLSTQLLQEDNVPVNVIYYE